MLPHNSFCSHNRTVGSQILHIKVSRMTTLTQKYSKVGRSFYCSHILLKFWPCTLHLTLAGTDVKYSKVFWFHTWAFSLGADHSFLHLHHTCKSQTNKILFPVWMSVAGRAFMEREVTAHHICQLRSDRPQNAQLNAERCQNMFRGWCPSDTFQMTRGKLLILNFPLHLRNKGSFHIHDPKENFCCPFSQPSLSREEQGCGSSSPEPKHPFWEQSWLHRGIWKHF